MFGVSYYCYFCLELRSPHRGHSYSSISPGRFFAANEVKALLAHIVIAYDIKFEERKQRAPRPGEGERDVQEAPNVKCCRH
jgi:hypothetical protein